MALELVLVEEFNPEWTIAEIGKKHRPLGWEELFEESEADLELISETLAGHDLVPRKQDIFRAYDLTPLDQVKVVILGQDPYPGFFQVDGRTIPRATGLSFSIHRGDSARSLDKVFAELEKEYETFVTPSHGDLSHWARQGVLLLNTALTTEAGVSKAHVKVWKGFFEKTIKQIARKRPNVVFLLWGREAQSITKLIPNCKYLKAGHPSPLNRNQDFLGCDHFRKTNSILVANGERPIDWQIV